MDKLTVTDLQWATWDIRNMANTLYDNAHDLEGDREYEHESLTVLRQLQRKIDAATALQVAQARAKGLSWETIGDALTMSRQAAWERYRD